MIAVTVDHLFLSNLGFVVLLKPAAGNRALPIFIGAAEAQAIALHLNKVSVPRPLTHDLMKQILDGMACRLLRVVIGRVEEGTFFAELILERNGAQTTLDCRPSDGMALALRMAAPIFVADTVMETAGQEIDIAGIEAQAEPTPKAKPTRRLTPLEQLERQLKRAIKAERYEEAARLRDEIQRLKDSHKPN